MYHDEIPTPSPFLPEPKSGILLNSYSKACYQSMIVEEGNQILTPSLRVRHSVGDLEDDDDALRPMIYTSQIPIEIHRFISQASTPVMRELCDKDDIFIYIYIYRLTRNISANIV